MHKLIKVIPGLMAAGLLVAAPATTQAANTATIHASAVDLDGAGAGNIWRYTYSISADSAFTAGQGFDIFFEYAIFGALSNPQPDNGPDWYSYAALPDPNYPNAPTYVGTYLFGSLSSLGNGAPYPAFTVDVEWVGDGTPNDYRQEFNLYGANSLRPIHTGLTNVPEGGPSLLAAGLLFASMLGLKSTRRMIGQQVTR